MDDDLRQEKTRRMETELFRTLPEEEKKTISWEEEEQEIFLPKNIILTSRSLIDTYAHHISMLIKGEFVIDEKKGPVKHTLKELADYANCSIQAISKIKDGKNKSINIEYLNRIAKKLGCSSYFLLGLSEDTGATCIDSMIFHHAFSIIPEADFRELELDAYDLANWVRGNPELYKAFRTATEFDEEQKRLLCDLVGVFKRSNYAKSEKAKSISNDW